MFPGQNRNMAHALHIAQDYKIQNNICLSVFLLFGEFYYGIFNILSFLVTKYQAILYEKMSSENKYLP